MIASVRGKVLVRRPDHAVIECSGVGYRLELSAQALKKVPAIGKEAQLQTHLIAKEDSTSLYGFASEEERELFLMLISVAGVGPKVAISVLSQMPPRGLYKAIASEDTELFKSVPGVGRKTADRIIVELKDRVSEHLPERGVAVDQATRGPRLLARDGLVELGYSVLEAESMLGRVSSDIEAVEEIISQALQMSSTVTSEELKK